MKKYLLLSLLFLGMSTAMFAQSKYFTKTGTATFFAESTLKDAKAENHQVRAILDASTAEIAVSVLIRSFEFEKALMQTHFNADVDSEKYPKASFEGKITNINEVDLQKDGIYSPLAKGKLTLHGVTKDVSQAGTLTVKAGQRILTAEFVINTDDYGIPVRPGVDKDVKITLEFNLEALAK